MDISLRQLLVFVAVADARTITSAGDALGLPQSSVSSELRKLEESLGLRLFDRHTRMRRLTKAGQEILPLARIILADVNAIRNSSNQLSSLARGQVSIGASSLQAALVLPAAINRFAKSHPGIKVEVFDVSQSTVLSMVKNGEVDFGVGTSFDGELGLMTRPLYSEPYCVALQRGHHLAGRDQIGWRDLKSETLVGSRRGNPVRTLLDDALARAGISLDYTYETSLPLTAIGMVECGLGVGVLTYSSHKIAAGMGLVMKPVVQPRVERGVVLVFHPERSLSPAAKRLSDELQAQARVSNLFTGNPEHEE